MSGRKLIEYLGGVPTGPDVKLLRDTYPEEELSVGRIIPYEDVEQLIQAKRRSFRFQTVTQKWRGQISHETDIVIGTERGIGFKVLSDHEKVELVASKTNMAINSSGKALFYSTKVESRNVSKEDRERLHHIEMVNGNILAAAQLRKRVDSKFHQPKTRGGQHDYGTLPPYSRRPNSFSDAR